MASFYVGQRVKATHCRYEPNAGKTGVITEVGSGECNVRWDQAFTGFDSRIFPTAYPAGTSAWAQNYEIEPILPPKSQELVSWESMPCNRDGSYRHTEAA